MAVGGTCSCSAAFDHDLFDVTDARRRPTPSLVWTCQAPCMENSQQEWSARRLPERHRRRKCAFRELHPDLTRSQAVAGRVEAILEGDVASNKRVPPRLSRSVDDRG